MEAPESEFSRLSAASRPVDSWTSGGLESLLAVRAEWLEASFRGREEVLTNALEWARKHQAEWMPSADDDWPRWLWRNCREPQSIPERLETGLGRVATPPMLAPIVANALGRVGGGALQGLTACAIGAIIHRLLEALAQVSKSAAAAHSGADAWTLASMYPCLGRLWHTIVRQWVDETAEFIARLRVDAPLLEERFGIADPVASLETMRCGLSDRHHGGRSVLWLEFSGARSLIYKPRSLRLDVELQKLLEWWSGLRPEDCPPRHAILDCGTHGWVEAVPRCPVLSDEEMGRYARKAGALGFLSWLLRGADLHSENVLATVEGPIAVDVECFFQPLVAGTRVGSDDDFVAQIEDWDETGLLPNPVVRARGRPDSSGFLGGDSDAILEGGGVPRNKPLRGNYLLPELASFLEGFTGAWEFFAAHREWVRDWCMSIGAVRARYLLRPTTNYGFVLQRVLESPALVSAIRQAFVLDRLVPALFRAGPTHVFASALASERRQLNEWDVPVFSVGVDHHDLVSEVEGVVSRGCFSKSGLELVLTRLDGLSQKPPQEFLDVLANRVGKRGPSRSHGPGNPEAVADSESEAIPLTVRGMVAALVAAVKQRAEWTEQGLPMWAGIGRRQSWAGRMGTGSNFYLYDGLSGIGLFLAAAGRTLGDEEASRYADAIFGAFARYVKESDVRRSLTREPSGAYEGVGSVILGLAAAATVSSSDVWLETALELAGILCRDWEASTVGGDVSAGTPGLLLALAELWQLTRFPGIMAPLACLAARTESCFVPSLGLFVSEGQALAGGLAHGSSGIAMALARAASALGEPAPPCVAGALAGEASVYARLKREGRGRNAWCAGAASQVIALQSVAADVGEDSGNAAFYSEASADLISGPLSALDFLCCGNAGKLAAAQRICDEASIQTYALALASRARAGVRFALEPDAAPHHPGFFRGISGIGYSLLRVLNPALPDIVSARATQPQSPTNATKS